MDYRALLQDRRKKAVKQKVEHDFCLSPDLLGDLEDLQAARAEAEWPFSQRIALIRAESAERMTGPADTSAMEAERDAALAELDQQIEAKREEIRDASLILHFQAISSTEYGDLVNKFDPNKDDASFRRFTDALIPACWVKATTASGAPTDLTWADILASGPNSGEVDAISTRVLAANRIGVDIPFSLSPSARTRRPDKR